MTFLFSDFSIADCGTKAGVMDLIHVAGYGIDDCKAEANQGVDAAHGKTGYEILKELVC